MMQMFKYPHGEGGCLSRCECGPLPHRERFFTPDLTRFTPLLSRCVLRKQRTQTTAGKGGKGHGG